MTRVQLGARADGHKLWIDLPRLIETRLLIQANSGAGKSYLIRKLLEETHGKVQQIVLDVEGEFSSLRAKYDYVLAGKGGDVRADPKTAELLARKLIELEASAIVDLYELRMAERIHFVKLFLDSLMNMPRELWHPVLIVIDEAHLFAPEKGQAESMNSVIDLATRGRKREFAVVLATQRISSVRKDVVAQTLNKLIGRTGLDIDMKRAADELGFTSKEDTRSLRNLKPGEFYAFGPAISDEVVQMKVGEVLTPHGKAARKMLARQPAPTGKVKQVLAKLQDLPAQAEEELRDRQSMLAKIRELERERKNLLKIQPPRDPATEEKIRNQAFQSGLEKGLAEVRKMQTNFAKYKNRLQAKLHELGALVEAMPVAPELQKTVAIPTKNHSLAAPVAAVVPIASRRPAPVADGEIKLGPTELAILRFLAVRTDRWFSSTQIGVQTRYSRRSSTFQAALPKLVRAGLITKRGSDYAVTMDQWREAKDILGDAALEPAKDDPRDWLDKLQPTPKKVFEVLLDNPEAAFSREQLSELTGYSASSSTFQAAIPELVKLGLAQKVGQNIALSPNVNGA